MLFKNLFSVLTFAASAIALPVAAHTKGSALVQNNLDQDLWLWSVDTETQGPFLLERNKGYHAEDLRFNPATGIAIKISTSKELDANAGILQFAYTLHNQANTIYYDLSLVKGIPDWISNNKLTLKGGVGQPAPEIVWDHIKQIQPQNTKAYHGDYVDLTLVINAP